MQVLQRLRHVQRGLQQRPRARPPRRGLVEQAALQRLPDGACGPAGAACQRSLRARPPMRGAATCLPCAWEQAGRARPCRGACIMRQGMSGGRRRAARGRAPCTGTCGRMR